MPEHGPCGIAKSRDAPPLIAGPPNGPFVPRVSTTRQGVSGTNCSATGVLNTAVTVLVEVMVSVQLNPKLWSQLRQPVSRDCPVGAAVNVTGCPFQYWLEQVEPQLIPPSELLTVPLPLSDLLTVSVKRSFCVMVKQLISLPSWLPATSTL